MSLRLTRKLRARLAHASEALLSARDDASPAGWRDEVRAAVAELVGADFVGVRLPPQLLPPDARDAAPPVLESAWRQVLGAPIHGVHLALVPPDGAILATSVTAVPYLVAGLLCRREHGLFGQAALETLRLVGPAFRAGAVACLRVTQRRPLLCAALEGLAEGVALLDLDGRTLHQNHALEELLASEPEADRLLRAGDGVVAALRPSRLHPAAESFPPPGAAAAEVETATGRYRLFGTVLEPDAGGGGAGATILLVVEPRTRGLPDSAALCRRYGLSRREAEVAILLAQGRRNSHVASSLGISPHTARHHTEMVMAKLGRRSRAEIGAVLLGG